jgi:hypothetical protein
MRKQLEEYNYCRYCGCKAIHDPLTCMNKCPNCGRIWTDTFAERALPIFWETPVKVQFD